MNTTRLLLLAVLVVPVWMPATGLAQYTGNPGPNIQTTGAPANPLVQSIHPR